MDLKAHKIRSLDGCSLNKYCIGPVFVFIRQTVKYEERGINWCILSMLGKMVHF